jgi:hypothetical protein
MGLKQKLQEAATEVSDLKRMLADAERNFDAIYKQVIGGAKAKKNAPIEPEDVEIATGQENLLASMYQPSTPNFTDSIWALLVSEPDKEWSYGDIKKKLPAIPNTTIPSLLFRLKKNGKAVKMGRGKWKAAA